MFLFKYFKNEKGQSIVELAIILPVLLLLILGIFEFGRVMNAYLIINHAAREGARTGAVGNSDSYIIDKVINSTSTLDQSKLTITISPGQYSRTRGESIVVKVEYDIALIIPMIQSLIPNQYHLVAFTTMRIE